MHATSDQTATGQTAARAAAGGETATGETATGETATGEAAARAAVAVAGRGTRARSRLVGAAGVVVGILLVVGAIVAGVRLTRRHHARAALNAAVWSRRPVDAAALEREEGVRVETVALSGADGLLDLRFTVLDADRAEALHDPGLPPAIVDQDKGLVANSLLMGHAHSAPYHVGERYYLVFENPGNLIERGSTVSVLLGDVEIDGIPVR